MGFATSVPIDLLIGMEFVGQLVTSAKLGMNWMELVLNAIEVI